MALTRILAEQPARALVSLHDVYKHYGPVSALAGVTLDVHPGECLGLVGHNGAGKSTLVKIINGRIEASSGTISYDSSSIKGALSSRVTASNNAIEARTLGIRSVFQELSLCANLTVLENLRIPYQNMPKRRWRKMAKMRVEAALDTVFPGHGIDAHATVADLSIAQRQMVEIAIAFSERDTPPSLIILDEPTSSLDVSIAAQLLQYIEDFCRKGGSIVFISHMMSEIFDVATRIVVMKDGLITRDDHVDRFTRQGLVDAMGHVAVEAADSANRCERTLGKEVLRTPGGLIAREREIVGLAGLAGHGQATALANFYLSRSSQWRSPGKLDVAFVAGDRTRDGVFPLWSIIRNFSLTALVEFSGRLLTKQKVEQSLALAWKERISIRTDRLSNPMLSLSGGNQQKVLFARALASSARIVIMDDPMRGVDIGTKTEVYQMIQQEAANGRTFLWYSTETDEICLCDRVFVFRNGEIAAELTGNEITEENILSASFEMQESAA